MTRVVANLKVSNLELFSSTTTPTLVPTMPLEPSTTSLFQQAKPESATSLQSFSFPQPTKSLKQSFSYNTVKKPSYKLVKNSSPISSPSASSIPTLQPTNTVATTTTTTTTINNSTTTINNNTITTSSSFSPQQHHIQNNGKLF